MLPFSVPSSMAALLRRHQQQQQQQQQVAAAMMANTNNNQTTKSTTKPTVVLPPEIEEEVSRRKKVMAGTPYSITKQFPSRLFDMLTMAEEDPELEEIVSFLPDGRSFKVHDPARFESGLMRKFFNQTRYKSFQRQLNLWGFERKNDTVYKIKGTYSHPWFIRGRKDLIPLIVRVGGAGGKAKRDSMNGTDQDEEDIEVGEQQPTETSTETPDREPSETEVNSSKKATAKSSSSKKKKGEKTSAKQDNKSMANLYPEVFKKSPAVAGSSSSFLGTFQTLPKISLPGSKQTISSSEKDGSNNRLSSVLTALNRAEAIGSLTGNHGMDTSRNSTSSSDDLLGRLQQHRRASNASRSALIEQAMKISAERNFPSTINNQKGIGTNRTSMASLEASTSLGRDAILRQMLAQQQQQELQWRQHQDSQAIAEAALREAVNKQALQQLLAGRTQASVGTDDHQLLMRLLAESAGTSAAAGYDHSALLEKIRLEEGIQNLRMERARLEAAAILEERERRRLEVLAAARMQL